MGNRAFTQDQVTGYIQVPPGMEDNAFAAKVSSEAMSPKYHTGDVVIFSTSQEWKDGDDCHVRLVDGTSTFRRLYREPGERIRLEPRCIRFDPRTVATSEVKTVSVAVYRYELLTERGAA